MREGPDIASLAALIGDPARANMLAALMSGMALTAGELAREAGVTPQTASGHLAKLSAAGLLTTEVQGRHRYLRLAGPEVAGAIEALMAMAARTGQLRTRPGPHDAAMRRARVCYDHLAGAMAVRLYEAFVERGDLAATSAGLGLTATGRRRFVAEGIDVAALEARARPLCRACLDWSERRPHLAGSFAAALLQTFIGRGWVRKETGSRTVTFSPVGLQGLEAFLAADGGFAPAAATATA